MIAIRQLSLSIAALSILLMFESCGSSDSQKDTEIEWVIDSELNHDLNNPAGAKLLKDIFKKKSVNSRDLAENNTSTSPVIST